MSEPFRDVLALALVAALLASCASTETGVPKEGQVVLQAGAAPSGSPSAVIVPGREIRRLAVLVPGVDPVWRVGWLEARRRRHREPRGRIPASSPGC